MTGRSSVPIAIAIYAHLDNYRQQGVAERAAHVIAKTMGYETELLCQKSIYKEVERH